MVYQLNHLKFIFLLPIISKSIFIHFIYLRLNFVNPLDSN